MITPIKHRDISAMLKNIKNTSELKPQRCVCVCDGEACGCNCDCTCTCNGAGGSDGNRTCNCACTCKKQEATGGKRATGFILAALVCMAALQGSPVMAQDGDEQLVMTFDIGDSQVSTLSEEQRAGRIDALTGLDPQMIQTCLPDSLYPSAVNAFLIRTPDKNMLVDAGYGRKLFDHLHALGLAAEDIHIVLLTHMHGDHIGGLLRDEKIAFPKAELYLSQPEYEYWMSDRRMQESPDRRNGFLQARKVIAAYKDRLHLFTPSDPGAETPAGVLPPGVQGIAAYGHTPGHTAYLFESGGARLLIWGDVNHAMAIQMLFPDVTYARDANPAQSIATRKRILSYVASKNIPIAGMHIAFPGIGDVVSTANGVYAFEPYCLCLGI